MNLFPISHKCYCSEFVNVNAILICRTFDYELEGQWFIIPIPTGSLLRARQPWLSGAAQRAAGPAEAGTEAVAGDSTPQWGQQRPHHYRH